METGVRTAYPTQGSYLRSSRQSVDGKAVHVGMSGFKTQSRGMTHDRQLNQQRVLDSRGYRK